MNERLRSLRSYVQYMQYNSLISLKRVAMKIEIITTGGTIDGTDSDKETVRHASDAARWLGEQPDIVSIHTPLLNKDSRLLTNDDRDQIIQAALNSESDCVLVTHGTFTICETGKAVKRAKEQQRPTSRTIILVGSWTPFGGTDSDAPSQMEFALKSLEQRPSGVFIAMDNQLWNPDTTEKVEVAPGIFRLCTVVPDRADSLPNPAPRQ